MKVKVCETKKIETEVEVEFPIYREHDVGSDSCPVTIYSKIDIVDLKLQLIQITVFSCSNSVELNIDNNYTFDGSGADYCLGRGEFTSSKEYFDNAVKKAQKLLDVAKTIDLAVEQPKAESTIDFTAEAKAYCKSKGLHFQYDSGYGSAFHGYTEGLKRGLELAQKKD